MGKIVYFLNEKYRQRDVFVLYWGRKKKKQREAAMKSVFDMEKLERLLKDFYAAVGIRISVFDDGFNLVTEYPKEPPRYCSYVRTAEAGRDGCKRCDYEACARAREG